MHAGMGSRIGLGEMSVVDKDIKRMLVIHVGGKPRDSVSIWKQ